MTYEVNRQIGQGSVVGAITTDGKTGVLSASDIVSWNLTLNGVGASIVLNNTDSTAGVNGGDLIATATRLNFNFSGTDAGLFSFQDSKVLFSGTRYWCNNTTNTACFPGDSVVPEAYNSPSAQHQNEFGLQAIGMAGPSITDAQLLESLLALIQARQLEMITNNLLSSLLLGFNEQVSCSNCGGADATFGSFNIGAHGRYSLTRDLTVLGGASIGQYHEGGADVQLSVTVAAALRYDPANMGGSRPFAEMGASISPNQRTVYSRPYAFSGGAATGAGKTDSSIYDLYGRVGWVSRVTPRDEVAVSVSAAHTWQVVKGYAEGVGDVNPISGVFPSGADQMTVVGLDAQYTRLLNRYIEAGVSAGLQHSIHPTSGIAATIGDAASLSARPSEQTWAVYGARIGLRLSRRFVTDAFVDGVSGPRGIGNTLHGGLGFRLSF